MSNSENIEKGFTVLLIVSLCLIALLIKFWPTETSQTIEGFKQFKLQDKITEDNLSVYSDDTYLMDYSLNDLKKTIIEDLPNVSVHSYDHGIDGAINGIYVIFTYKNKDVCEDTLNNVMASLYKKYDVPNFGIFNFGIIDKNKREINISGACEYKYSIRGEDYTFTIRYSSDYENQVIRDAQEEKESIKAEKVEIENSKKIINKYFADDKE